MKRVILILAQLLAGAAIADAPRIEQVETTRSGMGWRFDVTLSHPDTGWDHYADGWEILDTDGNRLGYRKLHHPHVDEQPFTRSLTDVIVPDGVRIVHVRASCSVENWVGPAVEVELSP